MKILLTGATGYIGKRILPVLVQNGHHVVCCARDKKRFNAPASLLPNISVIEVDFLKRDTLSA
ncbi:MAG: NAD(P)H-binding protein, partial [Bacteroidia bacterium]|nr:NAD(P)H-binding protein [Bacteroidia bacterium]NNM16797.1 NAD(P)H-binding protein [Bacteroidia bacterium]